jgi:HlyD family secretion protein
MPQVKKINGVIILSLIFYTSFILVSCKKNENMSFPGYVQGKYTYISAYYTGILKILRVNPGDYIKQGQPLFTLESFPENTDLVAANARVLQAIDEINRQDANHLLQKTTNERTIVLFKKAIISKEELEQSIERYQSAVASKKGAEANLIVEQANQSKAAWAAHQMNVTAPMDALVFDTYYSEHEKIPEGKPVLSLLVPGSVKIIFFIPEYLLSTLKLKQNIEVFCDGNQQLIKAKITYISPKEEYTPPIIFSDTERQNLVFRVEALPVETDSFLKINPGQPITVKLNVTNH